MSEWAYCLKEVVYQYPGSGFELSLDRLEISAGKIMALVGPNGAGKTSLLLLLALLQKPQRGSLEFFGKDPWHERRIFQLRQEIALVTHHPYLFRGTIYDNLVLGLKVRGVPEREWSSRVQEVLKMVDLWEWEEENVRGLSAGLAQRVALARAIILKPKVLLLDEPTANLDAGLASRMEAVIQEINAELKTTVIFSTHNFSRAFRLADQVIYLSEGRRVEYSHENYFSGKAESDGRLSWIEPKPGAKIYLLGNHQGHLTCLISPEKIELFPEHQKSHLSGPNLFSGKITRLELTENHLALLRVNGILNFRINLPMETLAEKKISLSSQVLLKFPPEAVEIIK